MLNLVGLSNPKDRQKIFEEYDPANTTWLVSDLQSKLDLQRNLFESHDFLEENSLLRVSELWQKLLTRVLPEYRIISRDLALILCRQSLQNSDLEWAQRPGVADKVFHYITQLMPVLVHPEGGDILSSWFKEKKSSHERWGQWAELAFSTWSFFLNKKLLAPQWVSGALVSEISQEKLWKKNLIVDVGPALTPVEAELLKALSKSVDVTILQPNSHWREEFQETTKAYEILGELKSDSIENEKESSAHFLRFTTMIAEVKNAVGQVREWLDQGVELKRVSIAAANIESYWVPLQVHLKEEGVPVTKKVVGRLQSSPLVMSWLSELRLQQMKFSKGDLETRLFSAESDQVMDFETFERFFSTACGEEDLSRVKSVQTLYQKEMNVESLQGQLEFITWAIKNWTYIDSLENLSMIVSRFFVETPPELSLSLRDWLSFLESIVARIEVEVEPAALEGISCLNLASIEHSDVTHVIVLGATEANLVSQDKLSISNSDVLSLMNQTGFYLSYPENKELLFSLRWLMERGLLQLMTSFPETDFSGAAQAPSLVWLKGRMSSGEPEEKNIPKKTRLDEKQESEVETTVESPYVFAEGAVKSLSATSLERYFECPFRFAAEKVFGLSDLPSLDLDVDRMTRGALLHLIFEKLLPADRKTWDVGDEDLDELLDKAYKESHAPLVDERLWPPLKEKYRVLARRFLNFEQEWQSQFPKTQTVGREQKVKGYFNLESSSFSKEPGGDGPYFVVRGSIDRIDSDGEGQFVLLDYKSTRGSLRQFSSWKENGQYQMAFYTMAFEAGLTDLTPGIVVGGLYYIVKEMNRDVGFKLVDGGEDLFAISGRSRNKLDTEKKRDLLGELKEQIQINAKSIYSGEFQAKPKDVKICPDCRWNKLCRAEHLQ